MAIIHTRTVRKIEVLPAINRPHPQITVWYTYTFDDTEDAELPVTTDKRVDLIYSTEYLDPDTDQVTVTITDISSHDPLVQAVAAGIWPQQ